MRALPAIFLFPRRAAGILKVRPHWFVVFLILAVLRIGGHWAENEAVTREVLQHLPPSASPLDRRAAAEYLHSDLSVRLMMEPLLLAASWSAFAGLLWVLCGLAGGSLPVRWSHLWALEVHAEAIPTLFEVLTAAMTAVTGDFRPDALVRSLSLAVLASDSLSPPAVLLLSSLNLCTLWFVGVLGTGLAVLSGSSTRTGILMAGISWGISAVGTSLLLHFLRTTLHIVV